MRDERGVAEPHLVAVVNNAINWLFLAAWPHLQQAIQVFAHHDDLRASQFLDKGIGLHMVAMRMASEDNANVLECEPEGFDVLANRGNG